MIKPTCACGSTDFEITKLDAIKYANFAYSGICCSSCHVLVSVVDARHIPTEILTSESRLSTKLDRLINIGEKILSSVTYKFR